MSYRKILIRSGRAESDIDNIMVIVTVRYDQICISKSAIKQLIKTFPHPQKFRQNESYVENHSSLISLWIKVMLGSCVISSIKRYLKLLVSIMEDLLHRSEDKISSQKNDRSCRNEFNDFLNKNSLFIED